MSEFKGSQKMKVVPLHEQSPKQCFDPSQTPKTAQNTKEQNTNSQNGLKPTPNPKITYQGPQKVMDDPKIK